MFNNRKGSYMSAENLERIARNKNVARAAARQLSMEQLGKLAEIVQEAIDAKKEEELQRQKAAEAKARKLDEIRKELEEAGLSPEDLAAVAKPKRGRPRKKDTTIQ